MSVCILPFEDKNVNLMLTIFPFVEKMLDALVVSSIMKEQST